MKGSDIVKSLKSKLLSKKVMLSLVAAGVMSVGVCGSAWAADPVNINTKDITCDVAKSITATSDKTAVTIDVSGLTAINNTTIVNVGTVDTDNITLSSNSGRTFYNRGGILNIHGKNITLEDTAGSENNRTRGFGVTTIGGNETELITIISKGDAINLMPYTEDGKAKPHTNARVSLTAKEVVINSEGTGIWAQNNGTDKTNYNNITINADDIRIKAGDSGIVSISQSEVVLNGNVDIVAKDVITTRGYSKVTINSSGDKTVKLNGDIDFNYDGETSGTPVNADVNIVLNGADSYWNGNAKVTWSNLTEAKHANIKDIITVDSLHITLNEGATWNATAPVKAKDEKNASGQYDGQQYVGINTLTMKGGIVNIQKDDNIDIHNLNGSGATFNMLDNPDASITVGEFNNDDVTLNGGWMNLNRETTIKGVLALNKGARVDVGNLEEGSMSDKQRKNFRLASTATLKFDDLTNYKDKAAIIVSGDFVAEKGAKVAITKAEEGTYKIVEANKVVNNMTDDDIQYESGMMTGTWVNTDTEMNLTVKAGNLAAMAITTDENKTFLQEAVEKANVLAQNPETKGFADLLNSVQQVLVAGNGSNAAKQVVRTALAGAMQAGEVGGATSTAVSIVNNVAGITGGHMSIATPAPAGGKGVGLMDKDSGAGVWAQYVHGKDKANALPMNGGTTEYRNSYNGIVVGADFKQVDKFQSGVAFNYVDGDGSSVFNNTISGHTDFKAYGLTYYGAIKNDTVNTMFDLSYNHSKADSKQNNLSGQIKATQKTNTLSAGVTLEKAFIDAKTNAQFVPYVGARYMHISANDYANSIGIKTAVDNQNVFLLPVGVKFRQENKLKNGWTVTPKADLSYVWAMGDTENDMTVSAPGVTSTSRLGYTVMDKGSFLGVLGLEASKNNWTYGLSYSYQKGDKQRSDKYFLDIKYTF